MDIFYLIIQYIKTELQLKVKLFYYFKSSWNIEQQGRVLTDFLFLVRPLKKAGVNVIKKRLNIFIFNSLLKINIYLISVCYQGKFNLFFLQKWRSIISLYRLKFKQFYVPEKTLDSYAVDSYVIFKVYRWSFHRKYSINELKVVLPHWKNLDTPMLSSKYNVFYN